MYVFAGTKEVEDGKEKRLYVCGLPYFGPLGYEHNLSMRIYSIQMDFTVAKVKSNVGIQYGEIMRERPHDKITIGSARLSVLILIFDV